MKSISKRRIRLWQFIKFNLVGVLNTLVDILVFTMLLWLGVHYTIAQCISYGCGTANSYMLNKRWTFGQMGAASTRQMMRFIVVNLTVLAISIGLLYIVSNWWQLPELTAKLIVTLITVIMNFAGNRLWVFKSNYS